MSKKIVCNKIMSTLAKWTMWLIVVLIITMLGCSIIDIIIGSVTGKWK